MCWLLYMDTREFNLCIISFQSYLHHQRNDFVIPLKQPHLLNHQHHNHHNPSIWHLNSRYFTLLIVVFPRIFEWSNPISVNHPSHFIFISIPPSYPTLQIVIRCHPKNSLSSERLYSLPTTFWLVDCCIPPRHWLVTFYLSPPPFFHHYHWYQILILISLSPLKEPTTFK